MKKLDFTNSMVEVVSKYIQTYLNANKIDSISADDCADLLAKNKILSNKIGPKPGFNFRQMLRDGRDKKIDLVTGAHQVRPRTKWTIYRQKIASL